MNDNDKLLEPAPEPSAFDHALTFAKTVSLPVSFVIPPFGSAVSLFDSITAPIRGKRFSEWCEKLRLRLNELSATVADLTPEKLAASEEFTSAFAQAAQAAIRTHDQEKLDALRNAVLNTARGKHFDDERQAMFLSLLDRLQPAHLRILKIFQAPPPRGSYGQWQPITIQNPGTPTRWIKEFVPGLKDEDANFIRMLITDLYNAGLVFIAPGAQNMPIDSRLITDLGTSFLNFISEPSK